MHEVNSNMPGPFLKSVLINNWGILNQLIQVEYILNDNILIFEEGNVDKMKMMAFILILEMKISILLFKYFLRQYYVEMYTKMYS